MGWGEIAGIIGGAITVLGTITVAILSFFSKKTEVKSNENINEQSVIGLRWDDASELATKMRDYIDSEVEKQVERQVAPIRQKLSEVEAESHEIAVAVRSREVQLWMWDNQGRAGLMPQLPAIVLSKLGISHLFTSDEHDTIIGNKPGKET